MRLEGVPQTATSPVSDLESLYRQKYHPMVRLAFLLTGSDEVARDVAQDAFVEVHLRWASVARPVPYLRQAVLNGCRSWQRRQRVERRHAAGDTVEPADLGADELRDALAGLPFRQRAAITLRFYEDLSEAEIAAVLDCRAGTVGPLIHRGLERLRREIER